MVFSSVEFLFYFLPITLAAYFVADRFSTRTIRNVVLLIASLLFYAWSSGALVLLLVVSTVVDFVLGARVAKARDAGDDRTKRLAVAASVVVNLSMLGYFKYANFLIDSLNDLGLGEIAWSSVTLPVGISFFTFQSMSYTIDVSRGRCDHLSNPLDFALYVALFPQLVAGPIVRYHEIATELRERSSRAEDIAQGALRFGHGLAKKVIVADAVGGIADAAFAADGGDLTFAAAWLGILAYTIQIYFDFSGYSDMAIGLGRILGFHFPENFRRPYSAVSITDFWRRWHITLSNWFRDYVYIPLGGSHGSSQSMYRNLVAIFVLTGIWHGANWTFLVWGIYHGAWMLFERITNTRSLEGTTRPWMRRIITLLIVMVGWVFFRADSLGDAFAYLSAMVTPDLSGLNEAVSVAIDRRALAALGLASIVFLLPASFTMGPKVESSPGRLTTLYRVGLYAVALPYAAVLIASGTFSPFLYFQF